MTGTLYKKTQSTNAAMHLAQHPLVQRAAIPWNWFWPATLAFRARGSDMRFRRAPESGQQGLQPLKLVCSGKVDQVYILGASGFAQCFLLSRVRLDAMNFRGTDQRSGLIRFQHLRQTPSQPSRQRKQKGNSSSTPGWVPSSVNRLVDPAGSIASRWL